MKKTCLRSFCAALFGFALALGGISSTYAQQSDADEFVLEEITVTAQKRAENQQKVPIQMEVIAGEDLSGTGKDNVDDILRDISNVLINKSPDGMRVTVRGLADEGSPWHDMHVSTPTVAVNIDGAFNSSSAAGQNLFDLERVEVLAGPQSTLYGSNSPGGIVNVVTASPKTDRFSASASAELGNFGLFDGQVMVNAPIVRGLLAMRLAAQKYQRDSWVTGNDNSQDTTTARLKTLIQPNDDFSATVTLSYSEAVSGGRLGGDVDVFDYEDGYYQDGTPVTDPWSTNDSDDGGGAPPGPPPGGGGSSEGSVVSGAPNAMGQNAETKGIQAEISWNAPFGSLTFVPSYSKQEATEFRDDVEVQLSTGTGYTSQYSENSTEQKNAELRLASPEDFFFKWIVGGTYYESDRKNFTDDYYYESNDSIQNTTQENKAVYANLTYPIIDSFRGTAGYRRSWDEAGNVEQPAKVGDGVTGQKYSNPDYKVGIEYDLSDSSMLYANYATSYRVNAMAISQATGAGDKTVPPEELQSYTIGAKNRFLDNRIQLNASAYYYDYENKRFQASEEGRFGGAPGAAVTIRESDYPHDGLPGTDLNNDGDYNDTNLSPDDPGLLPGESSDLLGKDLSDPWIQQFGAFESYGVDVSLDWVPTSKDRLSFSLSYLHAEWTDAVIEFYWSWIWESHGDDYSGRTNTFSPKWSGRASYQHSFELGSFGTLLPQVDVSYQSSYNLSFAEDVYPFNYQEAHYILNGSVSFTHASGMWSLNAYIKNATDYAVKTFWMNRAGSYSLGLNDPRTYGAVVSIKF